MDNDRPQLVIHVCCAPDAAWTLETLGGCYEIHCFFCNPNIQPQEEYRLRLREARTLVDRYGVPFSVDPYDPHAWQEAVKGVEHSGEGGERCLRCFLLRFRRTARFCREKGYSAFTSVMSVSPHKNFRMLCEAGAIAASEYGVRFEPIDLKKNDGFSKSVRLSRALGLYRQNYCGCILSLREAEARK